MVGLGIFSNTLGQQSVSDDKSNFSRIDIDRDLVSVHLCPVLIVII